FAASLSAARYARGGAGWAFGFSSERGLERFGRDGVRLGVGCRAT
ncbi:MAG: hypothetical protein ACJAVJ_000832, partial [Planctomycetota bacterium]